MRIAIIKMGALGDVVRTTGVLRLLKKRHPQSEIWWYTSPSSVPLLEQNPLIDKIVRMETSTRAADSENNAFDWVISLDEEPIACELCSRLKARERFGAYQETDGRLSYTASSRAWFEMSLLRRDPDGSLATANRLKKLNRKPYPQLLSEMLGFSPYVPEDARPVIYPDSPTMQNAVTSRLRLKLQKGRPVVGLNSGAGGRWINKQLTLEKAKSVIARISRECRVNLVLLGGKDEKERHRLLMQASPPGLIDGGTDHSLREFISLVNACDLVITTDSLALHLATALKKRFIVLFGPTSSAEIELYGEGQAWLPARECQCFYRPHCEQKDVFCLDTLSEDGLIEQLKKGLS